MSEVTLAAWQATWRELGAPQADATLFRQLTSAWSQPHRHYHTPRHLRECLQHFAAARHLARAPAEVELALWFHDAIYEPKRDDNEVRSAEWARESVMRAGLPAQQAQRIHALVMCTAHGNEPLDDEDARLLVDVDLAILGSPAERFDEYERQVRAEYAHVPTAEFRQGRQRLLEGFLMRPRLYRSAYFIDRLEAAAKANLRRALDRLGSG